MIKTYNQFVNESNNPYEKDHKLRKDLCLKDPNETIEQSSNEVYKNGTLLAAMEYFTIEYSNGEPIKYCFKNVSPKTIYISNSKDTSEVYQYIESGEQLSLSLAK